MVELGSEAHSQALSLAASCHPGHEKCCLLLRLIMEIQDLGKQVFLHQNCIRKQEAQGEMLETEENRLSCSKSHVGLLSCVGTGMQECANPGMAPASGMHLSQREGVRVVASLCGHFYK